MWLFILISVAILVGFLAYVVYVCTSAYKIRKNQKEIIAIQKAKDSDNNIVRENPIQKPTYEEIKPDSLNYEDVILRYLSTEHNATPSKYNHYDYFKAEFDCILNHIPRFDITLSEHKLYRQGVAELPYEKSKNITVRTNINTIKDFIALDLETTGLKVSGNDIIEVTAIRFESFEPKEVFTTLLKPRKPITKEISEINGITDDMVVDSPKLSQIHDSFISFLGDYPIVMHNAKFDLKFLYGSGVELDYENLKVYDTLELSRRSIRDYENEPLENYKLNTVCNELSIYYSKAHRATSDALATGLLFNEIVKIKRNISDLTQIEYY